MEPRDKRTRAKGKKVRTGCKTCKTRHLKCDEAKPHCFRCQKDGFVCEGYPAIPKYRARKQKRIEEARSRQPAYDAEEGVACIQFPRLTSNISPIPPEVELLHHVRTCTVEEFRMTLSPTDFWDIHVLPLAYTVQPIKAALCALGGADRLFKSGLLQSNCPSSQAREAICISEYNRAIEHIVSMARSPSKTSMETVLTCCVLFICVENLLGRYAESLRHLKAGCLLLASFRKGFIHDTQTPTHEKATFYDNLKSILYGLGQDVADYMGVDLFLTLRPAMEDPAQVQERTPRFKSAAAAAKSLVHFEDDYGRRLHQAQYLRRCEIEQATGGGDAVTSLLDAPSWCFQLESSEREVVKQAFWDWNERFELFKSQIDEQSCSKQELHQIRILSLQRTGWSAAVEMRSFDEVISPRLCEAILEEAEVIIKSQSLSSAPTFTLCGRIIPSIAMVYTSSADQQLQKRCMTILRSMKGREGMWDSQEIADIMESMFMAAKDNRISWEVLPWKVPLLAEVASALKIPRLRISRGALSLSNLDPETPILLKRYSIRPKRPLDNPIDL